MHTCVHAPHTGGGGGIPFQVIGRKYTEGTNFRPHAYNTLSVLYIGLGLGLARTLTRKTGLHSLKMFYTTYITLDYKTGFKMTTRKGVTNWGEFLARKIW